MMDTSRELASVASWPRFATTAAAQHWVGVPLFANFLRGLLLDAHIAVDVAHGRHGTDSARAVSGLEGLDKLVNLRARSLQTPPPMINYLYNFSSSCHHAGLGPLRSSQRVQCGASQSVTKGPWSSRSVQ